MQHLVTFETLVELGFVNNRVTLSRRIKRGEFPAPIRIGSRNVAWLQSEIDAWQTERVVKRDQSRGPSSAAA
jgi:prophage regulatory protein